MLGPSRRRKKNSALFQPSLVSGRRGIKRRRGTTFGLIFVAVVLIALIFFARAKAGGAFWFLAAPLYAASAAVESHFAYVAAPFMAKETLVAENKTLTSKLALAEARAADQGALAAQNASLQAELGRVGQAHAAPLLANILARPPQLPYDELMLDAGSAEGAAVGSIVGSGSAALGILVGVSSADSRAELFSAPGASTDALLSGITPITLTGDGGGALEAQVPQDVPAAVGDTAVLPGLSSDAVGVIQHIDAQDGSSFKELYFSLPFNIFSLPYVEIWQNTSAPSSTLARPLSS